MSICASHELSQARQFLLDNGLSAPQPQWGLSHCCGGSCAVAPDSSRCRSLHAGPPCATPFSRTLCSRPAPVAGFVFPRLSSDRGAAGLLGSPLSAEDVIDHYFYSCLPPRVYDAMVETADDAAFLRQKLCEELSFLALPC